MLWKSLAWGLCTAVASALATLAVFVFIVPRLVDAPDLSALTFAVMAGHGGFFIGLLHPDCSSKFPRYSHSRRGTKGLTSCVSYSAPSWRGQRQMWHSGTVDRLWGDAHPICRLSKLTATEYRSLSGQCPGGQLTTLSAVGSVQKSA